MYGSFQPIQYCTSLTSRCDRDGVHFIIPSTFRQLGLRRPTTDTRHSAGSGASGRTLVEYLFTAFGAVFLCIHGYNLTLESRSLLAPACFIGVYFGGS